MKDTRRSLAVLVLLAILHSLPLAQQGPSKETGTFRQLELIELIKLDPAIRLDIRYATKNNFPGRPVYKEARAFIQLAPLIPDIDMYAQNTLRQLFQDSCRQNVIT